MEDPLPLVEHCYEMYIEMRQNLNRTGEEDEEAGRQLEAQGKSDTDISLFKSLYTESTVPLPGRRKHNKYINLYIHSGTYRDTTPITPSKFYQFTNMSEEVVLDAAPGAELPECFMAIGKPQPAVTRSLLSTCQSLQPVEDLYMDGVRCGESPGVKPLTISSNARSVVIKESVLPAEFLSGILHHLKRCGGTLQRLRLSDVDLQRVESELDELLEALTSHYQQAGPAHGKLILWIYGRETKTNLTQKFVTKWREKCQNIESIDKKRLRIE